MGAEITRCAGAVQAPILNVPPVAVRSTNPGDCPDPTAPDAIVPVPDEPLNVTDSTSISAVAPAAPAASVIVPPFKVSGACERFRFPFPATFNEPLFWVNSLPPSNVTV